MRSAFRLKLRLFSGVIILFAVLIIIRLYFVQVVHGQDFSLKAEHQYASSQSPFDRGSIYFTRKDGTLISAAALTNGFRIALNPEVLKDADAAYAAVSGSTTVDKEAFFASAAKKDDPYEVVAEHVTETAGQAIADKKVPGVLVERERWRTYPAGSEAAPSVGFVAYSEGDSALSGRYGLERYYDETLARGGSGLFGNFFAELFANLNSVTGDPRDAREGDLITTIEPVVEQKLDDVIAAANKKYGSTVTGGIVMNPATGEIIALDTYPTFDPNDLKNANVSEFGNPLVESIYEFGSIMKPLTMTAGLDAGVITPASTYNDTGCVTLNSSTFCNYDLKPRGPNTPMQQILSQSLNVGAAFIAGRLGHDQFRTYFTKLGFGTETGIDLPSEVHGQIQNLNSPRDIEYATASFGQGIAETPVEMIRALGALANHGAIVTPHLVSAIRLESGLAKPLYWGEPEQVFTPGAVKETTDMLVTVVDTALANGKDKNPLMTVAAKTGTAQIPGPDGKYAAGQYFHSFFGYFPAYNPRFIILLYTRKPQGVQYASETLTEPFMELTHFLTDYYNIPPDRTDETSS
jgi:cell division protein FtsI/penicillin-binding protein 2